MMLILLVFAFFLINENVIAAPANSSISTENESFLVIVFNTCSQDHPCFVSYKISYGNVAYKSSILGSAEKSYFPYFPYANTTIGLDVTVFKHIDVHDRGTVITTKKFGVGDNEGRCFAVRGNDYSIPTVSKCSFDEELEARNSSRILRIRNKSSPPFVLNVALRHGNKTKEQKKIFASQKADFTFVAGTTKDGVVNYSIYKLKNETSATWEPIQQSIPLRWIFDECLKVTGNYENPLISPTECVKG